MWKEHSLPGSLRIQAVSIAGAASFHLKFWCLPAWAIWITGQWVHICGHVYSIIILPPHYPHSIPGQTEVSFQCKPSERWQLNFEFHLPKHPVPLFWFQCLEFMAHLTDTIFATGNSSILSQLIAASAESPTASLPWTDLRFGENLSKTKLLDSMTWLLSRSLTTKVLLKNKKGPYKA